MISCLGCGKRMRQDHSEHYWCNEICLASHIQREDKANGTDIYARIGEMRKWSLRQIKAARANTSRSQTSRE